MIGDFAGDDDAVPPPRRRRARRVASRVVVALEIGVIGFVLVVAAAVWIVLHAVAAADHLQDLRGDVNRVRADLIDGRDAHADLATAQHDAHQANHDTHDPVWWAASWIAPVKTVRGLASVSNDLAQHSLPPIVSVGSTVQPSRLRVAHNQIALSPLQVAAPTLQQADAATAAATARVAKLPAGWVGPIAAARRKVLTQLQSLSGSVDAAARFTKIGPAMLGADGKRRYFVGVQNNAEARATGGLVAAYAIVTADHGTIKVVKRGNDGELRDAPHPVVNLGADYNEQYGNYDPERRWITSNISPDFPDAANIWAHLWQAQSGQHIDGSFGVDPVALGKLVQATGPVTIKGNSQVFTGANLATFIESTEYQEYPSITASGPRKDFVSKVAGAVLHKLLSGAGQPSGIATALGQSAGGGHLELWSGHPQEQAVLSGTPLSGELPSTSAPYVSLSVDNATGSKLDYYLDRTVTYQAASCGGDYTRRSATVTVTLDNAAPAHGLPPYVMLRGDQGNQIRTQTTAQNHDFVLIHVTKGDYLTDATLDGKPLRLTPNDEAGRPSYLLDLELNPGVPRTIRLSLSEPDPRGPATARAQPLARPQVTHLLLPNCV